MLVCLASHVTGCNQTRGRSQNLPTMIMQWMRAGTRTAGIGGNEVAMTRRLLCRTAFAIAASTFAVGASPVAAQDYPSRPITFVVAFAPGGFSDAVARLIGSKLGERLGQNIVIENRAGGGGNIGAAVVSK